MHGTYFHTFPSIGQVRGFDYIIVAEAEVDDNRAFKKPPTNVSTKLKNPKPLDGTSTARRRPI